MVEQELICHCAYAPLVCFQAIPTPDDLRCDVEWCAEERRQFLVAADHAHVALVDHLEVALPVEHEVGRFDVAVDQPVLVEEPE